MKKKTISSLIIAILIVSIVLAGCGSTKETNTAEKKQREFVYAMSGLFKPFNYKEDGKLTGFDVEIGEALAKKMDMKPKAITFPFETIIQGLRDQKFDAILGSMTVTEERLKAVDFTNPYYKSGSRIFVSANNNEIKSKADLKGKKIGVTPATIYEKLARELTDQDKVMVYSQGDMTALMDLATGRVDAVICDDIFGRVGVTQGDLKIKPVDELLQIDNQAIATNKEDPELTKKINQALDEIIADGTYEKISKKWFGYYLMDTGK
ncbi:transporter substrate-binding domain-containing protein [Neobacillus sp. SuZ13]|uniref:transporter substrate-binding domain-containing protein n=1 Tax=Neobacillus sp. SuZ13 TaxID=3047875 RepID=UPI0024C09C15|nr:transporter substrate-binding domain-containing protein [Neobacillus sp. SuZ13]WHY64715.1 transporter substrate-binding domain-containing protein [Neobacillus sp. SuZ13]